MDISFAKQNKGGNYGTLGFQNTSFNGITNVVYDDDENNLVRGTDSSVKHDTGDKSLDILNVKYVVQQWMGSWWKGACFRKVRQKVVLDDISIRLKSGEITAILGNSGKLEAHV